LFPAAKHTFLKALEACRKDENEDEDDEKEEETSFLGRKMRTLLLAGDYLSNFLFGNAQTSTKARGNTKDNNNNNEGELCLWSRTLRNDGRFFVNVGSFSSDKMDSYVEIDSSALGIRKGAEQLLGFLYKPAQDKVDEEEEERSGENRKSISLALLTKQMFGALDSLLFDVLDLDQTELRRSHLSVKPSTNFYTGGSKLREYDVDTLLQL
jgi:hypothetical protein